jgi:hypothetical protein
MGNRLAPVKLPYFAHNAALYIVACRVIVASDNSRPCAIVAHSVTKELHCLTGEKVAIVPGTFNLVF